MTCRAFTVLLWLASVVTAKIPDYIHPCKANDPNLSDCIIKAIYDLRPQLIKGIPELDVPPLQPLRLKEIQLTNGITANISNVDVYGAANFEIIELRANVPKNRFAFIVKLPVLQFAGKYEMNSRLLLLNLYGEGPITGNFTDYSFSATLKGKRVSIANNEYLEFDKMKLNINIGNSYLYLRNLFNGNKALESLTNQVINDSSEALINEVRPAIETALIDVFTTIANKITLRFTINELFL